MIKSKKILAITLARGGSKSVKLKNIKNINGKPLIYYTIKEALRSKYIDDYIVSTDSKKISYIAKKFGANVPFLRAKKFSTDKSTSQDALNHSLKQYEKIKNIKYDYIVSIMCTNPLKTYKDIDACIKRLHLTKADTVISVKRLYDHHPKRIKKIINGKIKNFVMKENEKERRQDLKPKAYIRNGSIYAISRKTLVNYRSQIGKKSYAYIMPDNRSINIDEKIDFQLAELMLKKK